jgi:nucleoid DNA-binding protein
MEQETLPGQAGNEVDLTDLIAQVVAENYPNESLADSKIIEKALREDLKTFFHKAGLGLVNSEGNRVELHDIGVLKLEHRAARKGTLKGNAWETPERHEITFTASPKFAELVGEALGTPVY